MGIIRNVLGIVQDVLWLLWYELRKMEIVRNLISVVAYVLRVCETYLHAMELLYDFPSQYSMLWKYILTTQTCSLKACVHELLPFRNCQQCHWSPSRNCISSLWACLGLNYLVERSATMVKDIVARRRLTQKGVVLVKKAISKIIQYRKL